MLFSKIVFKLECLSRSLQCSALAFAVQYTGHAGLESKLCNKIFFLLQTKLEKNEICWNSVIKYVLFFIISRIRKGFPFEARVVARILPQFLDDFFPPQDVMNKVIGEFLSNQQPYPQFMATVVYKVTFTSSFVFLECLRRFQITDSSEGQISILLDLKKAVAVIELYCCELCLPRNWNHQFNDL